MKRAATIGGLALTLVAGCHFYPNPWSNCQDGEPFGLRTAHRDTAQVSNNPFAVQPPPQAPTRTTFAPAKEETAWRVDRLGREIVAANPQLGLKPGYVTLGAPQAEIFHRDDKMLVVTEGLIRQCKNDAEVAAVLCHEFGRMVADRESLTPAEVRNPERLRPINSNFGGAAGPDQTALAELGRFEKEQPKKKRFLPRPDSDKIARACLEKAGYKGEDLDAVQPILRAAERNCALENQFKGVMPQSNWTP